MIQFIHEDIYKKRKRVPCKQSIRNDSYLFKEHTYYIYTSDNNPKYFQGSGGGGIASPSIASISFCCKTFYIKSCLDVGWW